MKNLVIGLGEVGSAVKEILNCDGFDKDGDIIGAEYDIIHVCIPFSHQFVATISQYQSVYNAKYVVVHSTVPLGTCDPEGWVHSPVRGVHPNMVEGIKTFKKYFGGTHSIEVANEFEKLGMEVVCFDQARTAEALKLWDTTQYGVMIALEKEIHAYCERNNVRFDLVYQHANQSYNEGYTKLGRPEVVRPFLNHVDGPIGGHCVIPNATILNNSEPLENPLVQKLLILDEELEQSE